MIDEFMPEIEELIEASHGRIGADHVHKKLIASGFTGTDRTTRRAVGAVQDSHCAACVSRTVRQWVDLGVRQHPETTIYGTTLRCSSGRRLHKSDRDGGSHRIA